MNCAVALILLLDASGSVGFPEWRMQIEGHAEALASPEIARVIEREGGVAVQVRAFADTSAAIMPWRVLATAAEAHQAAVDLLTAYRPFNGGTAIGDAMADGLREMEQAPCGDQRVMDVVTDGENNGGRVPSAVRAEAEASGVQVNALGVRGPMGSPFAWLRENVATARGFVVEAEDWDDFARAIRRKITWEIAER